MTQDVRQRAEWRDSVKGRVCLWLCDHWRGVLFCGIIMALGVAGYE